MHAQDVVDIGGCGLGKLADHQGGVCIDACTSDPQPSVRQTIEERGYEYLAIDILQAPGVRQEDLTRLSFKDGAIARIISCDTIEHIPDYPTAFREMFRVLQPGGITILHFPVYFFDRPVGSAIIPNSDRWGHVRYFSAREMLQLFDAIGFAVLRSQFNFDYGALVAVLAKPGK